MLLKIFWADICKKKAITLILTFFVMLAAFLIAASSNMIVELISSVNYLFTKSSAPHFVQMHEGTLNRQAVEQWVSHNNLVKKGQFVEMLLIDDSDVQMGDKQTSEKNSVMNLDFVTQNDSFDFLINLNGQIIYPSSGEIAVPIYFMQRNNLQIGDKVKITTKNFKKEFVIVDFIRDVQMNPSIIHSKRFLINPADFNQLKKYSKKSIYLLEFQFSDLNKLRNFSNQYQLSDLPKNGPSLDYNLYRILNSVTDGITIGMIILLSILLTIVAILCLRFTIITTMEEDYKQIGIMKAIGISQHNIKRCYLVKYAFIAALACVLGYITSLFLKQLFMTNIMLYLGIAPGSILRHLVPFIAVVAIFLLILFSCLLVLRKFNRITALEALREGVVVKANTNKNKNFLSLGKSKFLNPNILYGLRDVFQRFRMFVLLFFIFLVCSFIVILPINFFNTIKSPSFISYMGVGRSDVRIDLRQSNHTMNNFKNIIAMIQNDKDVKRYSPLITSRFKIMNANGSSESMNIETGDFSIFPIKYLQGRAPMQHNDIALSYLNAKQLKKNLGDTLNVIVDGQTKPMVVTGIYQDITNGGKTAKALITPHPETALWYVVNVDFKSNVIITNKINEYARIFHSARVTDLDDYLSQTMGDLISQIKNISILTVIVAVFISVLITSLFLKMLVAKHYSQIAIMKAIGFSLNDIRLQYLARSLFVLNLGILFGAIMSNTVGQKLVGIMWSFMGASEIKFIINPLQIYIVCPLLLMSVVTMTTLVSIALIKKIHITKMIIE